MQKNPIHKVYLISFLFTLHLSLSAYVNSSFLTQIISPKYVGLLYTTAAIITLYTFSKNVWILKKFGNKKFVLTVLFINILSLIAIIISKNPYLISFAFIGFITTNNLTLFGLDIFTEHFQNKKTIARNRGLYLSIINGAWTISPLITSFLVFSSKNYLLVYKIALAIVLIMTIGLLFVIKKFKDAPYKKTPLWENYLYMKNNQNMKSITVINFILQFFFSIMIVYTPIYLIKYIGLNWNQLGIIFTIMLSPFVIFGISTGIAIEKYNFHKRTLLYLGFIIMILSVSVISFVKSENIFIWASILFMTRMGASIVQATSEIYFFTHVKEEDASLLGIFRDMDPLAYIIAPLFATILFLFLPFVYIFPALAGILAIALYFIPKLKHNHEYTLSSTNK